MLSYIITESNESVQRKELQHEYNMRSYHTSIIHIISSKHSYTYWISLAPFLRRLSLRKHKEQVNINIFQMVNSTYVWFW